MSQSSYLDAEGPIPFAHRGGAMVAHNLGIENSLTAFTHAFELGYRYFETDVRATKDGVPVACHDERLDRLAGDAKAIRDVHSSELEHLSLGGKDQIVPLETLLEAFPEVHFNIDIKSNDAVTPTIQIVRERELVSRVCLAAFDHTRLVQVRAIAPEMLTSASTRETGLMVSGFSVPKSPRVFQVPVRYRGVPVVTPLFIAKAHRYGKHVHVWTIDDPQEMHRLLDMGVDGVMTDRTDLLKDVLIERGQWKEPS